MSLHLRKEDKLLRRSFLKRVETILQSRRMELQFVSVRVKEVERVAFAVIVLPLLDSARQKTFTQTREVFLREGQGDMIVGVTRAPLQESYLQVQTYPHVARKEMRSLVPACDRIQTQKVGRGVESSVQIRHRKSDVIDAQDHGSQATPSPLVEVQP